MLNSSTTRQLRPNAIVLSEHPVEDLNQLTYLSSEITRMVAAKQFGCMGQALGKSLNQLPPNFKSL